MAGEFQLAPISGRFKSGWDSNDLQLELRVDVDAIRPHAQVLNVISGDFFKRGPSETSFVAGFICKEWQKVEDDATHVRITGQAMVFNNKDMLSLLLDIQLLKVTKRATVSVDFKNGHLHGIPSSLTFNCIRVSKYFRTVQLDVDYQDIKYCMPVFRTLWHKGLHAKYGDMEYSVFDAYKEAGIDFARDEKLSGNIVEDPDDSDEWKMEELMEKLKLEVKRWTNQPQCWKVWFLLADRFAHRQLKGIMFDFHQDKGRNGAAVFVDLHRNLPPWQRFGKPKTKKEVEALWDYLFTCVHEIGHALNLSHAFASSRFFPKGRESALSWMNYPEKYSSGEKHGYADFFVDFRFEFDRFELMFMRHGYYNDVKPGNSSFCGLKVLREFFSEEVKSMPELASPTILSPLPQPVPHNFLTTATKL
jgi:hypothetical protein